MEPIEIINKLNILMNIGERMSDTYLKATIKLAKYIAYPSREMGTNFLLDKKSLTIP